MLESGFYNMDCMDAMREFPDKFFELAIVDPPYGVGNFTQSDRKNKYGEYKWNEAPPTDEYFKELTRVSKRRIIWGANYYNCFEGGHAAIIWNKENPHPSMSVCEIASYSEGKRVSYFKSPYYGFVGTSNNIHPCQKPTVLYEWLLQNYAHRGDKILDTHVGSASSLIACHRMGFEYWGFELDADYFKAASERLAREKATTPLFEPQEIYKQEGLTFDT